MIAYHFSLLRYRGWIRVGLIGAALAFPAAAIAHAFGWLGEGDRALIGVIEFIVGGMASSLILGFSAGWILRGFAVRNRDDDGGEETHRATDPRPRR